jgi:hypothetical protein
MQGVEPSTASDAGAGLDISRRFSRVNLRFYARGRECLGPFGQLERFTSI